MPLAKKEQRLLIIGRKRGCHTLDIGIQNKTKSWRSPGLGGKSQQSTNDKQRPYCQKAGYQNTSEIRLTCMTCTCGKRITEIQVDLGLCMGGFLKARAALKQFPQCIGHSRALLAQLSPPVYFSRNKRIIWCNQSKENLLFLHVNEPPLALLLNSGVAKQVGMWYYIHGTVWNPFDGGGTWISFC